MQFGTRDEFEYFECADCGCLQICEIPEDLSKYYPKNYYSYSPPNCAIQYDKKGIRGLKERFVRDQITKLYLNRNSRVGAWLEKRSSLSANYSSAMDWMKLKRLSLGLRLNSNILDVGCGSGHLLNEMAAHGFSKLTGVDTFIEQNLRYDNGVKILRKDLEQLHGPFDFIMLHHSFEHLPEPLSILRKIYTLLNSKCYVLIRIPVTRSYAWMKYGVNWASLDAPRHIYLHTVESMDLLAHQTGFRVVDVVFDANGFGLIASEQYLKNISLMDPRSFFVDPSKSIFSESELIAFREMDRQLNKNGEADCAGFYLYKD